MSKKSSSKPLIFLVGLIFSMACLYKAFQGLSFGEVFGAMRQADFIWILGAMGIYSFGFAFRTLRWKGFLQPIRPVKAPELLGPLVIGFFANNVLPFRMGEVVRAHVAGEKLNISRAAALATIVVERIFDTISFLSIFLVVTIFFPFPPAIKHAAYVMAVGCAGLIVFLLLASTHQDKAHALIARSPLRASWQEKLIDLIRNFAHGVAGMKDIGYVTKAISFSMIIWAIEGSTVYFIARAFPAAQLTYPQAYFLLFFLGLSVTIPQGPGYVGTMELFGVMALKALGVPKDLSLPIVLSIHGSQFLFIALLGLWALWKEGRMAAFWKGLSSLQETEA